MTEKSAGQPSSSNKNQPPKPTPPTRHNPNDLDIQEGQERMQSPPKNPQPYERNPPDK